MSQLYHWVFLARSQSYFHNCETTIVNIWINGYMIKCVAHSQLVFVYAEIMQIKCCISMYGMMPVIT